jgi:protein-S-isoprenylcysteine O-methyltransferase Ste14
MRLYASIALAVTLFNQMAAAARIFKPVREEALKLRVNLIWLASFVTVAHAYRASPEIWQMVAGTVGLLLSIILFEWARRSIRGKFFSYLSCGDRPEFVWTGGPYTWIRNPFYTSYLIAYSSAVIMVPDEISAVVLLVMVWLFSSAAIFEEKKFAESPLANEYAAYMRRTGRFLPRLKG